jgi:hypothetical protein
MNGREFVHQLTRHNIHRFGQQPKHGGVLADPRVVQQLANVIDAYCHRHPEWKGDDAILEAVPFLWGPKWFRRSVAIPRCTNSLSLYVFLIMDALVCITAVKLARASLNRWCPHFMENGTDTFLGSTVLGAFITEHRRHLPFVIAVLVTIVVVLVMFHFLHKFIPWVDSPHLVLTVVITLHLFAYTSLDTLLPDIRF